MVPVLLCGPLCKAASLLVAQRKSNLCCCWERGLRAQLLAHPAPFVLEPEIFTLAATAPCCQTLPAPSGCSVSVTAWLGPARPVLSSAISHQRGGVLLVAPSSCLNPKALGALYVFLGREGSVVQKKKKNKPNKLKGYRLTVLLH